MTDSPVSAAPASSRAGLAAAAAACAISAAWLVSRVFLGIDFTDEMQYYGEIEGLMRTGRFFQNDLFVQQLGYIFVLPLFKLHALVFPDQSYFVLFGRLVLLAGYTTGGWILWRSLATMRVSRSARLAGLAVFLGWIPFQIFALSYNTVSYLTCITLVSLWLQRDHMSRPWYLRSAAAGLCVLTYTYPPAGFGLLAVAAIETATRVNVRAAVELVAATAALGIAVALAIAILQGPSLWQDVTTAAQFSRAFGVGEAILIPDQFASWVALMLGGGVFMWRRLAGAKFSNPLRATQPPAARWTAVVVLVVGNAVTFAFAVNWTLSYFTTCAHQLAVILLAACVERTQDRDIVGWIATRALAGSAAALLAFATTLSTGYFATALFTVVLAMLLVIPDASAPRRVVGLAALGMILGTIFSATSGNGIHNFGLGAAVVVPFLLAILADALGSSTSDTLARPLVPLAVALLLVNAVLHPYREDPIWKGFARIADVPAFKGLWVSPLKAEALACLRQASDSMQLDKKTLLVAGPHPWIYFATGAQPRTSMFYMHWGAPEKVFDLVSARLFQNGAPEIIVLPHRVPAAVHRQILEWSKAGAVMRTITLPVGLTTRYQQMTRQDLQPEVIVLSRANKTP